MLGVVPALGENGKGEEVEAGAVPDLPIDRIETTDQQNPYFPRPDGLAQLILFVINNVIAQ